MIRKQRNTFIFTILIVLLGIHAKAQEVTFSNTDRATFIMDIAQYVTWKNDKKIDIFRIGILDNDTSFFRDFAPMAGIRTIQGRPATAKLFTQIIDIQDVDIVFVNRNTGFDIDLVYQQVKGRQVLLLSENYPFHKSMINFIVVDGKKRFEINQNRLDEEGLKVTVTFSALSVKSELDWHKIYAETEKELLEQKEKITQLNKETELQKEEIKKQETVLLALLEEVNLQKKRLLTYMEEIEMLENETESQREASVLLLRDIRQKQTLLKTQGDKLSQMAIDIKEKKSENIRQESILKEQKSAIALQKDKIETQSTILTQQLEKLSLQKIIINLGIALLILLSILGYFIYRSYKIKKQSIIALKEKNKVIEEQKRLVETEKEKTEALLLNILPFKVAEDLKFKGFTEPEEFREVSVFFSDFVGFTEISSGLPPKVLIDELNILYTAFDNIMQKHNCERIKTIGDAYMAVCGMPVPDPKHALQMVEAAREILDFIEKRKETAPIKWQLRIGIHSGRVVGGIVGVKKFIYDIFGDTINVASRMESNGLPMRINVSETTYNLVKENYNFEKREPIEVKGKGLTDMYFLKK